MGADTGKPTPNRLRELRKQRGLSQAAIAERAGCTAVQIGHLENGKSAMTVHWMRKLAAILDVYPSDILLHSDRNPRTASSGAINEGLLGDILTVAMSYAEKLRKSERRSISTTALAEVVKTLYAEFSSDPPSRSAIEKQAALLLKFASTS